MSLVLDLGPVSEENNQLQLDLQPETFYDNPSVQQSNSNLAYDANNYQKLDHRSHVYQIPDTYIGSAEKEPRYAVLLDMTDPSNLKMFENKITLPEGVERLFLEVLSNAGDNVGKSRLAGIDPGKIIVKMDRETISVRNGGRIIPIEIHPTQGIYVPEMIFGCLLTSDNYAKNKQRSGAGRNGYGAKITNVFSKYFSVRIGDPQTGYTYFQEWNKNMINRFEPIISNGYNGESFVEVTYKMDQPRFGYQEYPDEAFALFAKHAADMAFNHKIVVEFNQVQLKLNNITDYAKCRFGSEIKTLVHYEWPAGTQTNKKSNGLIIAKDQNVLPVIELALVDTPGEGKTVAFTNAMINEEGGVHVEAAMKAIKTNILNKINKALSKSLGSKNEKGGPRLTAIDLKRHLSIIIAYRAINAKFRGQTKEKLVSPKPVITVDENRFKCIGNWNLVDKLITALEAKRDRAISKTDGKRRRFVNIASASEANWAGTKRSSECILVLTEGLSAKSYAELLFGHSDKNDTENKNGGSYRNRIGFLPLRGKLLNVTGASKMQIAENKEIGAIKKMLGLVEKTDYTDPKNRATLRYGKICVIADPDVDGKHILCLVINYFNQRFPSILWNEMVFFVKVPIIRVQLRNNILKFYNLAEYEKWQEETSNADKWQVTYFKGLGTSEKHQIEDDYNTLYPVDIEYDNNANTYLDLAFNPKQTEKRKWLIERYQPDRRIGRHNRQCISHLINFELIEFSVADVIRSIPGFDGLKDSQRRILYTVLTEWKNQIGKEKMKDMKVARLGPLVASKTMYHHGEESLNNTIIGMAQQYMGSNNLSHLYPGGNFGSREENGKDAAQPRYPNTHPMWWLRLIYRPEDDAILKVALDEGQEIGFERYKPILPIALVNGCQGIATGFSTFIPPYNPMDLCIWLILHMHGFDVPELIPWYRGFKGTVKVAESRGGKKITSTNEGQLVLNLDSNGKIVEDDSDIFTEQTEEDEVSKEVVEGMGEDDLEYNLGTNRNKVKVRKSVYLRGNFTVYNDMIDITELPPGRSTHGYHIWLRKLLEDKKITDLQNYSTLAEPRFKITGFKNPTYRNLRLERSFGLSNMVLLDDNGKPRYYGSPNDLMLTFYHYRLETYRIRKDLMIERFNEKLVKLNYRMRFILAVINEELIVFKRKNEDIYHDMDQLQFPRELLKEVNLRQCTKEQVEKIKRQSAEMERELAMLKETPPIKIWENELVQFIKAYLKHYPDEVNRFIYPALQETVLNEFYRPCQEQPSLDIELPLN